MASLDELKKRMAEALASGDVKAIEEVAGEISKSKAERHKAEAEALRKEAEALAGAREKLATKIHKAVVAMPGLVEELGSVKAQGFTYKLNTPEVQYKSVSLAVPTVKAPRAGTGGGAGKSKDEYGMSLSEIFDKFATNEDKEKLASAESNSKQWQVKVAVKKRAIADNKLAPVK